MDILLIALGSAGDVHPFVGLGLALRARGHQVTIATNPYFEPLVARVGLPLAAIGTADEFREAMDDPDLWHPRRCFSLMVNRLLLPQLDRIYDLVAERYRPGETVVVAPSTALGARVAQEKLGVSLVTVHLQPGLLRSVHRAPLLAPLLLDDWVPKSLKRMQYWLSDRLLIDRMINRGLTAFRAQHGLPPVSRVFDAWWASPQRIVGLFPDWFGDPQPDWPAHLVTTGFLLWDEQGYSAPPPGLEAFLNAGPPPVVFTPGSAMLQGREFFRSAVEACRHLRSRGILLTKFPEQLPEHLPDDIAHFDYVPLGTLLPRAAAIVHHAGIGTLAQGLAAGIRQLAMPMGFDQPDNARRLERLGVGRVLPPRNFTGPRLALALDQLLSNPAIAARARDLAARFDTPQTVERTCCEIEAVGGSGQPQRLGSVA